MRKAPRLSPAPRAGLGRRRGRPLDAAASSAEPGSAATSMQAPSGLAPLLLLLLFRPPLRWGAAALPSSQLFPFGPPRGDGQVPPGDDETSEAVSLASPLLFYESRFSRLYVSPAGGLAPHTPRALEQWGVGGAWRLAEAQPAPGGGWVGGCRQGWHRMPGGSLRNGRRERRGLVGEGNVRDITVECP